VTPSLDIKRLHREWDRPEIRSACSDLARRLAELPPESLIYRGRNLLYRLELGGREVVAKAFPAPRTTLKRLQRLGRASKAVRAFDHASWMLERGIGTPEPFAAVESPDGAAWYICAWAEGCRPAWHIHDRKVPDSDRLSDELGAFIGRMHQAGAYHYDSTPGNILLRLHGEAAEFLVVDCNRMRFGRVSAWAGLRSLVQLDCQGRPFAAYCRARGWNPRLPAALYALRTAMHRLAWAFKNGTRPLRRKLGC
jgi:hypothetical protein